MDRLPSSPRLRKTTENDGTKSSEKQVAAIIPPTTAKKPRIEEKDVIKIARKRSSAELAAASLMLKPSHHCSLANSTIRIAFLLARATSSTRPICE